MEITKKPKVALPVQLYFLIAGRICTAGEVTAVTKEPYPAQTWRGEAAIVLKIGTPKKETGEPFVVYPHFYFYDERRAVQELRDKKLSSEYHERRPLFSFGVHGRYYNFPGHPDGMLRTEIFSRVCFADGQQIDINSFCGAVDPRVCAPHARFEDVPSIRERVAFGSMTPARDRLIRRQLTVKAEAGTKLVNAA